MKKTHNIPITLLASCLLWLSPHAIEAQKFDELIKVVATDRDTGDAYGFSVDVDGDYAVVGSWSDDHSSLTDAGAAYVLKKNGSGEWQQHEKLTAFDAANADLFGYGVAISGDYIIVGAYQEDEDATMPIPMTPISMAGSAYIFERNTSADTFALAQKITANVRHGSARFGQIVDIEGDYAIVRAAHEGFDDTNGVHIPGAGAAYIFERDGSGVWNQENKLVASDRDTSDQFGHDVNISANGYAIVSAFTEDHSNTASDNFLDGAGSAYIFVRGTTAPFDWTEQQKIVPDDRAASDWFGRSASIDGDFCVVGASAEDEDADGNDTKVEAGSAYIFKRSGTVWSQQTKIVASDRGSSDRFGARIDINGDYIIVGASSEDHNACDNDVKSAAGSAYVFKKENDTTWNEIFKLVPSDREANDYFGHAVSIDDNQQVLVGAYLEDENANDPPGTSMEAAGSAYFFDICDEVIADELFKVVATDRDTGDAYGFSVDVDGDYAVVGSWSDDHSSLTDAGAAYVLKKNGSGEWQQHEKLTAFDAANADLFGYGVAISGDYIIVGAYQEDEDATMPIPMTPISMAGSAYIFERNTSADTFALAQKITANVRHGSARFGQIVDIEGDYAIVRAAHEGFDDTNGVHIPGAGAAYIFERDGSGVWNQENKLVASDRDTSDQFGHDVNISANGYAIVSAFTEDHSNTASDNFLDGAGSAYIFVRGTTAPFDWTEQQKIVPDDRAASDWFGRSASIDGDFCVVGASAEDEDADGNDTKVEAGSAYIFKRSGTVWSQQTKIVASDRGSSDRFGARIDINGDYIIVGASSEDHDACEGDTKSASGSAYVFKKENDTTWNEVAKLVSTDREANDYFGHAVSIDDTQQILVGAYLEDENADDPPGTSMEAAGSAYFFGLTTITCTSGSPRLAAPSIKTIEKELLPNKAVAFKIYPNPIEDKHVSIRFGNEAYNESMAQLEIRDILGKVVQEERYKINTGLDHQVQLRDLQSGIYFISLFTQGQRFTQKVIVK